MIDFIHGQRHLREGDDLVGLINYMSRFRDGWQFLGFKKLTEDRGLSLRVKGIPYAAVHAKQRPSRTIHSDEITREAEIIRDGFLWPVCFYGGDNTSFMGRYRNPEDVLTMVYGPDAVNLRDDNMVFYNS